MDGIEVTYFCRYKNFEKHKKKKKTNRAFYNEKKYFNGPTELENKTMV
jgi:hypothetical protein